ncbi:ABC transporter permease [Spirillospora sp. NBC_01491]|uniref:ABC transporter permease n=1 Tax=Spirillospora sp. NBC_01491 TaxID=2976007 RepID=UPI002E327CC7|nr:ABC transporter permease [Spirillospora sp. NBC_01491]
MTPGLRDASGGGPGDAPGGMGSGLRALLAVTRKELRVLRRYPLSLLNSLLLTPLYQLVLPAVLLGAAFLVHGRALGMSALTGTTDFGGWLAIGLVGAILTGTVLSGPAQAMAGERNLGTLEQAWTMPVSRSALVLGYMGGMMALSLLSALTMVGAIALLFGVHYQWTAVLSFAVLAALLPGLVGMGFLSASLVLLWRQALGVTENLGYVVTVMSGVTFPVAVISSALQPVSYLIPTTWAIDLARYLALGTTPFVPPGAEAGALVLTSAGYLWAGRRLFARVERKVRLEGTVAQH